MIGTNSMCPFYRDVHLTESQIKGGKNSRDQLCVHFTEVSIL